MKLNNRIINKLVRFLQVSNSLAKGALYACARLGGFLTGEDQSPANTAVQEALNAMLTPYLASQLGN